MSYHLYPIRWSHAPRSPIVVCVCAVKPIDVRLLFTLIKSHTLIVLLYPKQKALMCQLLDGTWKNPNGLATVTIARYHNFPEKILSILFEMGFS